jgi:fucose 4-O-acetylase-like acetyltransferase
MDQNDIKNLPRNDQGVLVAGVLAFIASFFPYYGASEHFLGQTASASTSAWHGWNVVALLLILLATLAAAVQVFAASSAPNMPVSLTFVVAAASAIGTVILIIRSFTLSHGSVAGFSYGLKWGAYVLMILCIAQVAFAVMRLRASGEAMPWENRGAAPPATPPAA